MRLAERIDLTRDLRELWRLACEHDRSSIESGIGQSAARPFSADNCYARRYNELLAQRFGLHAISSVPYAVIAAPGVAS